jgi:predicted DNA-binding protein (MmcQ/YjbR family)
VTLESFYTYCASLDGVEETFPFGPDVLVMKVGDKMFALVNVEGFPVSANLKCDPERAVVLRSDYEGIEPGWHMNKTHWNTVQLNSDVPGDLVRELVDHSYDLVVASLPKAKRP